MNNPVLETIKKRRSIRIYREEQIKDEELNAILEAGCFAPSAHNDQSWHFTVVQNQELLSQLNVLSKEAAKTFPYEIIQKAANNPKYNIFHNAPTIIVVSGAKDAMLPDVDCAAATQNMLVAAESLNIGTCWNGFITFLFKSENGETYRKKLGIPDGFEPKYAITLGYKVKDDAQPPKRRENTVNFIR